MSNKEPQNDEVFNSIFEIPWSPLAPPKAGKPCWTFCGLKNNLQNQTVTLPLCQVCAMLSHAGAPDKGMLSSSPTDSVPGEGPQSHPNSKGEEQGSVSTSIRRTKTPAKLNIRLKVTGRRPDGYHELVSVMVPIDLFDLLEITATRTGGIELACSGLPVPRDESNLVYKAAQSFFLKTGHQEGLFIKLVKNIPIATGMGGGSSDAAATLLTLNEMRGRPLSKEALHDMALRLGADVPFFLYCRPSLARGVGDILEPLPNWPKLWYVVVTPRLQISTSWVFGRLKLELTTGEYDYINKYLDNNPTVIPPILENDLEKVTSTSFPIIETIKRLLVDAGAEGALMTGSGPSVFGVFRSSTEAERAREVIASQDVGNVIVATNWEREVIEH